MKRPLAVVIAFLALLPVVSAWWGTAGIEVGDTVRIVSDGPGVSTAVSPPFNVNGTVEVFFEVRGEAELYLQVSYLNGTEFVDALPPVPVPVRENWTPFSTTVEGNGVAVLVFILDGPGWVEVRNLTVRPSKGPLEVTGRSTDLEVTLVMNDTFRPGETIRADFYIRSLSRTFTRVDINLTVLYHGFEVFSYSHPSWRTYAPGRTVHIYHETELPILTPPGRYELVFTVIPEGGEPVTLAVEIRVEPTPEWFALTAFLVASFLVTSLLLWRNRGTVRAWYSSLSPGQRLVLYAVLSLLLSALLLAAGAEDRANLVALVAYYFLLVGVLNLWFEYFEPKRDSPGLRLGLGLVLVGLLSYLSGVFLAPVFLALGVAVVLKTLAGG